MISSYFNKNKSNQSNLTNLNNKKITQKNIYGNYLPSKSQNTQYSNKSKHVINNITAKNKLQNYKGFTKIKQTKINDENNGFLANCSYDMNEKAATLKNQNSCQFYDKKIDKCYQNQEQTIRSSITQDKLKNIVNMKKKIKKIQNQTFLKFPIIPQKVKFKRRYISKPCILNLSLKKDNQSEIYIHQPFNYNCLTQNNYDHQNINMLRSQVFKNQIANPSNRMIQNDQQMVQFPVFKDSQVFPGIRCQQIRNRIVPQRIDNDDQTDEQQVEKFLEKVKTDFLISMNKLKEMNQKLTFSEGLSDGSQKEQNNSLKNFNNSFQYQINSSN